jgi:hypothetical protein
MSRRATLTPSGLATVYCCNDCGATTVLPADEEPECWVLSWERLPGPPETLRLGYFDLCPPCTAAMRRPASTHPHAASKTAAIA